MAYNQYPYRASLKNLEEYLESIRWCSKNITKGLWTYNYERPYSLKFTIEKDYLLFLMRWS